MLARLLRKLTGATPREPRVADGTRVYAVGDIHGRADLLEALHGLILRDVLDFEGTRKVVVYLGDYVDRGPASRETIDLLLHAPLAGFEAVRLRGNHEQAMLDFLADPSVAPAWLSVGGGPTLASYGVAPDRRHGADMFARLQDDLRANLPARHARFLDGLAMSHVEGDYLFVHAGIRPGVALGAQRDDDLMWIRDDFLRWDGDFGKIVVHGHSITAAPEERANRIGIDTGAFSSGRLTALVLEGARRRFLATRTP